MTLLEIESLSSHYGRIPALQTVSMRVKPGELLVVIGANGAGKTTLMRVISGIRPASGGRILFEGADITALAAARRVRLGIAQVPEGRQVFPGLSVADNLLMGGFTRPASEVNDSVAQCLRLFPELAAKFRDLAGALSGGQQQMLAIARALMAKPRLLLLDEPGMGLAPRLVGEIFRQIRELKAQGVTILLVEQNARAALRIADRAYVMERGHTLLEGTGPELLANPRVREAYLGH